MSELMKMNSADRMIRMYLFIDIDSLFHKRTDSVFIIGQRYNNSVNLKWEWQQKNPAVPSGIELKSLCDCHQLVFTIRLVKLCPWFTACRKYTPLGKPDRSIWTLSLPSVR